MTEAFVHPRNQGLTAFTGHPGVPLRTCAARGIPRKLQRTRFATLLELSSPNPMMPISTREESQRVRALEQYGLAAHAGDPTLHELTQLAADVCGTPSAGISLLFSDAVHYLARVGPGPARSPRGNSPCELCQGETQVLEIPDARYHPAFRPDGILVGGRVSRFYAGAPLITQQGILLGCLFVQSPVPQTLTDRQRSSLGTLARQVVSRFELNVRGRHTDSGERDRLRAESALSVERNFVSTVLDTVGALVAVFDTAGRIVRFNRTCEQVSGYTSSQLLGHFVWERLIPVEDIPEAVETFKRLRAGEFPASFENAWRHRDGSLRRIAWTATALVDAQGQVNFLIASGIDVTEQRQAESTLRESEARYRQLIEGSLGIVCTHDLEGRILTVNTPGAASLGRTPEQMEGQALAAFLPNPSEPALREYLRRVTETGEAQGRIEMLGDDGELHVIAFRNKLIRLPERPPYVLAFGVDISDQVRAETKLRVLSRQSDSILESVGDGIYGIDLEGRVTVINPAAAQMLGYKAQDLLGRRMHEIIHSRHADGSAYPAEECPVLRTVQTLDTVRVHDDVFWRRDGTSFPVEYVARPQLDARQDHAGGIGNRPQAVGVVVAFRDTTERRALDRLKDEFISTVSHELRTPLTSLRAALGLVTGGALHAKPDKQRQMLAIAVGNTDRLIRLVNDFLDMERISSGSAELHPVQVPAQQLFERVLGLQQSAADKKKLKFNLQSNGVELYADPDRIVQVLTNLVSNAVKYSPQGGTIWLSARQTDEHEVSIAIHDQGRGIPQDKLERIFERFHQVDASDARQMGGTGLGLAICRSIVAQHGGRIWASSPPGEGATFRFTLPTRPVSRLGDAR